MRRTVVVLLIVLSGPVAASGSPPADCFARASGAQPAFRFQLSKAREVRRGEISIQRSDRAGLDFQSQILPDTAVERSGRKRSQRSEIRETPDSSRVSRSENWLCYEFSVEIPGNTPLPGRGSGGRRAKLTIAQFHQEPVGNRGPAAVLFLDLEPGGALIAQFGDAVGARRTVLEKSAPGHWWDIRIAATWSRDRDKARTLIWTRERDRGPFRLHVDDTRRNATTGHVYQKLGAYRSFIERDRDFARSAIALSYSNVRRNGRPARFAR